MRETRWTLSSVLPAGRTALWFNPDTDILFKLRILGLPFDSKLSVVAVELQPEPQPTNPHATVDQFNDPLGADLGQVRILRTSPLTPVPDICPPKE
jgi:hypothetical protein